MRIIAVASVLSALALAACASYAPPPPQRIVPLAPQPVNPVARQVLPPPMTPGASQPTTDMAMVQPANPAAAPEIRKPDLEDVFIHLMHEPAPPAAHATEKP